MRDASSTVLSPEDVGARSKDVPWYDKAIEGVKPAARELLEKYSRVPSEKVEEHILEIRDKAWEIFPYPCIGGFRFLDLTLSTLPQYPKVVQRIKDGEHFLDLGCCFGQEIRKLIFDGVPSELLHGTDLRPEFFELGYELFKDRDTCKTKFFPSNVFEANSERDTLNGTISIVYAGAFFHLFDRPEQLKVARRIVSLLVPKPGTMVLGRQVGNLTPGRFEHGTNNGGWMYRHNAGSWQAFWDEIGAETGTKWEVWAELRMTANFQKPGFNPGDVRQMYFAVRRVA